MLTHVLRGNEHSILVIDEPDIYLHPDLQRKLLHIVRKRFSQFFMATHSVEIVNEADSGDVASINPANKIAKRISSEDDYQALFNYIGSYENIDFSRLARAKRIVFFEGKDRRLLRKFALKVGAKHFPNDTDTTVLQAGGFGQWRRVKEVAWTFQTVLKLQVDIFVVFDKDYRSDEEIVSFLDNMKAEAIKCFVLKRKEIENYALTKKSLIAAIRSRQAERIAPSLYLSEEQIVNILDQVSDTFKHDTLGQIIGHRIKFLQSIGSPKDPGTISKEVSIDFQNWWRNLDMRFRIIGGKDFVSALSANLQRDKGFSITTNMIIDSLEPDEIDHDLKEIISDLDRFCDR